MRVGIVNLGTIVSGDWRAPFVEGDALVAEEGRLAAVGAVDAVAIERCDVVIDAGGATAIPGLIDSQVHVTFGDFTPRQNTVGYLSSYVHGGTTTALSASEVHVPGRPTDPAGVKALAVAAFKCFEHYRPGGMRVHGGSIILEPGLTGADFAEVRRAGVWLAKAGFGAVASARDYVALVRLAREAGLITTLHTGGASIPGSFPSPAPICSPSTRMSPSTSTAGRSPSRTAGSIGWPPKPASPCRSAPPETCGRPCCARRQPAATGLPTGS